MKDLIRLINKSNVKLDTIRHLIWQDEINDLFILTKYMEIYWYDNKTLSLFIWNSSIKTKVCEKRKIIYKEIECDNGFNCRTDSSNLAYLLQLGSRFKQRPHLHGRWILKKQELLGHKIIPYYIEPEVRGKIPKQFINGGNNT